MRNNWWPTSRTKKNTTSKHKNCTIFPVILRESDAEKTRFQPAKMQKMNTLFRTLEFKILRLFMKNKWWLTSRNTQNTTSKHKNCTIFPVILRERDAEKMRFQPPKTQKITTFFRTLEFKIWRLFMKNKWWLTSRTTQNTTSKHKNCTIFPLILREMGADKTRLERWNSKFRRYLWRRSDGSHPETHNTRLRNIKIAQFFHLS
jgi:hypothetical protein